jgi:hypothetical protein
LEDIKKDDNIFHLCNISEERFEMLFALNNMYGIFKPVSQTHGFYNSSSFELISTHICRRGNVDSILTDIMYGIKSGIISIKVNDVVVIKLEGKFFSFRYCGVLENGRSFIEIGRFVNREKEEIIGKIHSNRMVLSVMDGRLFKIDELDVSMKLYCISKEIFTLKNKKMLSNYSLYVLNPAGVECINPHGNPFVAMDNALFYYKNHKEMHKGKRKNAVLLLDKAELELVHDYRDLEDVKLII